MYAPAFVTVPPVAVNVTAPLLLFATVAVKVRVPPGASVAALGLIVTVVPGVGFGVGSFGVSFVSPPLPPHPERSAVAVRRASARRAERWDREITKV